METKNIETFQNKLENEGSDIIQASSAKQKTDCKDPANQKAQGISSGRVDDEENNTYLELVEGQTPRPTVVPLPEVRSPILEMALENRSAAYTWWTGRRKLTLIIILVIMTVATVVSLSATFFRGSSGVTVVTTNTTQKPTTCPTSGPLIRLANPVLEVDVRKQKRKQNRLLIGDFKDLAALPGGTAVVYNYINQNSTGLVWLLDKDGFINKLLYSCRSCSYIGGFIVRYSDILIMHHNGTIAQVDLSNATILQTYQVPDVKGIINWGHPIECEDPDQDLILLGDADKDQVITYQLSTGQKQVKITGLKFPTSVYRQVYNNNIYYVVCDYHRKVKIYNSTWDLVKETEGEGSGSGREGEPRVAVPSPEGDIIVSVVKKGILVFDMQAKFKFDLFTNITLPSIYTIASRYPYLWINHKSNKKEDNIYRYKIYKTPENKLSQEPN